MSKDNIIGSLTISLPGSKEKYSPAKALKLVREREEISIEKLSEETDFNADYIQKIERGLVEPSTGTMCKLLMALGQIKMTLNLQKKEK